MTVLDTRRQKALRAVRRSFESFLRDIEAWADGDITADDGIELEYPDMRADFVRQLSEPLHLYYLAIVRERREALVGREAAAGD